MYTKLTNRYWLRGKLIMDGAVHVGGGTPEPNIDMPVVRDRNGRPFIPGSSLRGAMRSLVERTLKTIAPARTCMLFDDVEIHPSCPTGNKPVATEINDLMEKGDTKQAHEKLMASLCDTCRLFGSPLAASKLKIFDLCLATGPINGNIRHGVGIDRDEGKARDQIKFEYEVIERGEKATEFSFEMIGENLGQIKPPGGDESADPDFALLGLVWKLAGKRLAIGGKSGSGLGGARLELSTVQYFDERGTHKLKDFLLAKDDGYATMGTAAFVDLLNEELGFYLEKRA